MSDIKWYVLLELPQAFQSKSSDPYADEKEKIELYPYRILNKYITKIARVLNHTNSSPEVKFNKQAKPSGLSEEERVEFYHLLNSPNPVLPGSISYQHVIAPYTPEELDEVFCEKLLIFRNEGKLDDFLNYHFESFAGEPKDFLSHIEELLNKKLDTIQSDTFRKVTPVIRLKTKREVLSWINAQRTELLLPLNQTSKKDSSRTKKATQANIDKGKKKKDIVISRYIALIDGTTPDKEQPKTHKQAIIRMIKDFNGSNPSYHKIGNNDDSRERMLNRTLKLIKRKN